MAAVKYTYLITDFLNDGVYAGGLGEEIGGSSITTVLSYINSNPDECDIYFESTLTGPEVTTLDGLVAAHDGMEPIVEAGLVLSPDGYGSFDWDSITLISGAVVYLDMMEFIENIYGDITTLSGVVEAVEESFTTISGTLQDQIDGITDTQVFSFALRESSQDYYEVSSTSWLVAAAFPFPGTDGASPTAFSIVGSRSGPTDISSCRLYDITNATEILVIEWTSVAKAIYTSTDLSNLSAAAAIIEVQISKSSNPAGKSRIHSAILR